mgnify:CR=1 FL=1
MNTNNTGLADDYAEPATFSPNLARAAAEEALINTNLRESVLLAGTLKGVMDDAVTTARNAARTHLLATLNLACILRTMHQKAAGKFAVLALYKNYRGAAQAQQYAMQLTGGASVPCT